MSQTRWGAFIQLLDIFIEKRTQQLSNRTDSIEVPSLRRFNGGYCDNKKSYSLNNCGRLFMGELCWFLLDENNQTSVKIVKEIICIEFMHSILFKLIT